MGNCLGKGNKNDVKDKGGMKLDPRRRSFSKRVDPWEKTGMVAFRSSNLKVSGIECSWAEIVLDISNTDKVVDRNTK